MCHVVPCYVTRSTVFSSANYVYANSNGLAAIITSQQCTNTSFCRVCSSVRACQRGGGGGAPGYPGDRQHGGRAGVGNGGGQVEHPPGAVLCGELLNVDASYEFV